MSDMYDLPEATHRVVDVDGFEQITPSPYICKCEVNTQENVRWIWCNQCNKAWKKSEVTND